MEVVCLVLRPKGNLRATGRATARSRRGTTAVSADWPVINLWELDAEALLAENDPGLIPWVPLARSPRPSADVLADCRDRLALVPDPTDRASLRSVTAILAGLTKDVKGLLNLFGGPEVMIDSPVLDELLKYAEERFEKRFREKVATEVGVSKAQKYVIAFLEARFGALPEEMRGQLTSITDLPRLDSLVPLAATAPDLAAFAAQL